MTLLEIILYLAVAGGMMLGVVNMGWRVEKSSMIIDNRGRLAEEISRSVTMISKEIRGAAGINQIDGNRIELESREADRNPTVIRLSGTDWEMGWGAGGSCPAADPCPVNSNQIEVTKLEFSDQSAGGKKTIGINLGLKGKSREGQDSATEVSFSAEIRSLK